MKFKRFLVLLFVFILALSACAPQPVADPPSDEADSLAQETEAATEEAATEEAADDEAGLPAACEEDEFGCAVIPEGETIKVGMGAPMLGDYSMFGIDISQAVALALQEDDGFEGWSYELVAEDTGGTPEGGAAVANKFVTDPTMVAIAGHIFSGSTDAAIPIYDKAGFPMMSPSATNPDLTQKGSAVFNRLAFTDAAQGEAAANLLFNDFGFTEIAVMHDGGTYGQGLADVVAATFEDLGGEVVAYEAVTPGEADYVAPLSAVDAAEPEAVYFGGYAAEAIVMMNQWSQAGLDDVLFFGCDGTFGVEFTDKTGANGEGAVAASLVPPDSEEKTAFDALYAENFPTEAGELSAFTWSSFDTGNVLIAAIESVAFVENGTLYVPRGALVDAVRNSDFFGLTGSVKCDEIGECNASGPAWYQVVDGAWTPLALASD
ncbi:MAG: branched-chain amino acid ABC transporter substrate-binding protein [Chloroflexota bacterium]|nr:branched-chain amino acid ABC transporter substrate-binding protein [Chloroflexota bacterium]